MKNKCQLPHQKCANCHIKNAPTATSKMRQLPHQKRANCHIIINYLIDYQLFNKIFKQLNFQ
jgi:hypothetical protein